MFFSNDPRSVAGWWPISGQLVPNILVIGIPGIWSGQSPIRWHSVPHQSHIYVSIVSSEGSLTEVPKLGTYMCCWVRVRGDPELWIPHNFFHSHLQVFGPSYMASPMYILSIPLHLIEWWCGFKVGGFLIIVAEIRGISIYGEVVIVL